MRILIVEDEPRLLNNLAKALREEGYAVDVSSDGADGIYKAEANDYDAIVLDVMLPKLDGWKLLERLRQTKATPVLMLTARESHNDRVRGLDLGADDYLVKPFDLGELFARIRALIRRNAKLPTNKFRLAPSRSTPANRTRCAKDRPSCSLRASLPFWNILRFIAVRSSHAQNFTSICSTRMTPRFQIF